MICPLCRQHHPETDSCGTLISGSGEPPGARRDDELIGQRLGSFEIVRVLGRGGMGTVYLGEHAVIGSKVAIKVLHRHLSLDREMVRRFQAEARATNLIGHENIVSIFDLGTLPQDRHYMVMEYLEGQPLSEVKGALEISRALELIRQLCDALAAAHRVGVIHRDLKTDNVFLVRRQGREQVKVLDFGIAKLLAGESPASQTLAGAILGTPEFMSPEQVCGAPVDARSDLYALGVIAYQMLTGRLPFTGGWAQVMLAHQTRQPQPLRTLRPELPKTLEEIVLRMLAKDPAARFASAGELLEALGETDRGASGAAPALAPRMGKTPTAEVPRLAVLTDRNGRRAVHLRDLTRAGAYLMLDQGLPPLGSRIQLELSLPGGKLAVGADVVQHVPPERARLWNRPPGVAVQFADAGAAFVKRFKALLAGTAQDVDLTAEAKRLVREVRGRFTGCPYQLLGVAQDAEFSEIRRATTNLLARLEPLREAALPSHLAESVRTLHDRVNYARITLGDPVHRAEHDGGIGNFRGVARCLAAGLRVDELEACRRRVLSHRRSAPASEIWLAGARAWEAEGDFERACAELARGLAEDPLHLELHRQYARLRRRCAGSATEAA